MKTKQTLLLSILIALFISFLFSSSLYLEYFSYTNIYLNSFLSLLAIFAILNSSKKILFFTGFFIGILWFYWLSFSFIHYDLSYLIPFVILGIALIYGIIFYLMALFENIYFKAFALFVLSFVHPFGFSWLQPEILFVNSIFSIQKEAFILIILSMLVLSVFKKYYKVLFLFPLCFALDQKVALSEDINLKIFMPEINIKQENKWKQDQRSEIIALNNRLILNAIEHNYDLIVLPETAYPLVLNKNEQLMNFLLEQSSKIDIVLGALNKKDNNYYNSSYHFSKNKLVIANKVVLVPFGEAVPLPEVIANYINDIFYEGAQDFLKASKATDFNIKGLNIRNAICYEATNDILFENLNGVKHMLVISNNAWFTPSIEPILQKQLLRYYAKKYGITIYHSVNGSPNYIIKP